MVWPKTERLLAQSLRRKKGRIMTPHEDLEIISDHLVPDMHLQCPNNASCPKDGVKMDPDAKEAIDTKDGLRAVVAWCPRGYGITENGVFVQKVH
jgi:hypothetical protein